jgi:hypothetical protein
VQHADECAGPGEPVAGQPCTGCRVAVLRKHAVITGHKADLVGTPTRRAAVPRTRAAADWRAVAKPGRIVRSPHESCGVSGLVIRPGRPRSGDPPESVSSRNG